MGRLLAGSGISLRVLLLPGPAVSADVFKASLGAPAQALSGIARPTVRDRVGDGTAAGGLHGLHHLQDGLSLAAAQVEGDHLCRFRQQAVQGGAVAIREIHHVDVVTHTGAIGGGPVAAEHLELFSASVSHLTHEGEEVVGNAQRVFANAAGRMGPDGVEIAQASDPPGVLSTGMQIGQHSLNSGLGVAVGVDRRNGSCRRDRNGFWISVDRSAAAEDKGVAAMGIHGLQQAATAVQVHIPVVKWLLHGLSNSFEAGEMDYGINPRRRLGEGLLKIPGAADVSLHLPQPRSGRRSSELAHTLKCDRAAVAEIVEDQQLMARLQQHQAGMAADEACPACNQELRQWVGNAVDSHHPTG